MLKLNTIPAHPGANTQRKRFGRGRGSGLGTTAGRGTKGQLARKSPDVGPVFEGGQTPFFRKLPKRGFTNVLRNTRAVINLRELDRLAKDVTEASVETLKKAGIVKGRPELLIVLAEGELKRPITVKAHRVSEGAQEKIKKAGGVVEILKIEPKKIERNKHKISKKK